MKNIVLTGMPGSGKSTLGVILAKAANMDFIDTDLIIQKNTGLKLQEIIDQRGQAAFLEEEEKALLSLDVTNTVIATGGSAVYSEQAMEYLKSGGVCVYLEVPYHELIRRIRNMRSRGIIISDTLEQTYEERKPLYEKHAYFTVPCCDMTLEETAEYILNRFDDFMK